MKRKINEIEQRLLSMGKEYFYSNKSSFVAYTGTDADVKLNDLENYPHMFVLACCMDRQMKAEKVWLIPYKIEQVLGTVEMSDLANVSLLEYQSIFSREKLHRFNEKMSVIFYNAVQRIHKNYDNDASLIWSGPVSSAEVVCRFLQFKGVGIKIATMATNILARDYHVLFSNYSAIDVSPDTHVKRVMYRLGLVEKPDVDLVIYKAKAICPTYPGIIDTPLFDIGRNYCFARKPSCKKCRMTDICPKVGVL